MRKYELMYIIRPNIEEDAKKALVARFEEIFFKIVGIVMKFSPIGAFGAMAYTIGNFGLGSLKSLGLLMAAVYITMFLFVVVVLGLIAKCI